MKVPVTGGSGFIGSHVVDRLLADGQEPRIFDMVGSRVPRARGGARDRRPARRRGRFVVRMWVRRNRPSRCDVGCERGDRRPCRARRARERLPNRAAARGRTAGGPTASSGTRARSGSTAARRETRPSNKGRTPRWRDRATSTRRPKLSGELYCRATAICTEFRPTHPAFRGSRTGRPRPRRSWRNLVSRASAGERRSRSPVAAASPPVRVRRGSANGVVAALEPEAAGKDATTLLVGTGQWTYGHRRRRAGGRQGCAWVSRTIRRPRHRPRSRERAA